MWESGTVWFAQWGRGWEWAAENQTQSHQRTYQPVPGSEKQSAFMVIHTEINLSHDCMDMTVYMHACMCVCVCVRVRVCVCVCTCACVCVCVC